LGFRFSLCLLSFKKARQKTFQREIVFLTSVSLEFEETFRVSLCKEMIAMPRIVQLSSHLADLIAAGEVVERPASVVKELTENAIDAGAHTVTAEIRRGGMTLIRVTDDGCGMASDDAETAFLRHATSKLRTESDLEAISTLGFRGEALAAISAVSRIELLTRRQEDALGTSLTLEGGTVTEKEEAGCPVGTTLLVQDLFYNTPARLKFMKKDTAEGAACLAALQRQALAHPEISFKWIRDGRQELLTPGDGQLRSAVYAVLGRDLALGFQPVESLGENITVRGFTSLPTCCRGTRAYQFFFVNGRTIKSRTLSAAVEQAYANQKMVGKFPGCVLHLTLKPGTVDVNVHPSKEEIKFGQERLVFSTVYSAVLSTLDADHTRPQAILHPKKSAENEAQTRPTFYPTAPAFTRPGPQISISSPPNSYPKRNQKRPSVGLLTALRDKEPKRSPTLSTAGAAPQENQNPAGPRESAVAVSPPEAEAVSVEESVNTTLPWRMTGELFQTYIVVEQGDKAILIDKHAAHERMNFDRMRQQDYRPMSQELMIPVAFTPGPEEAQALLDHMDDLDRLGFGMETLGNNGFAVRCAPDYLAPGEIPATLTELAEKLLATGTVSDRERQDTLLHTMACKAAIKGGWKSTHQELEQIAASVMSGQVKYCPHGRPVSIELSRQQLEKQFKRT